LKEDWLSLIENKIGLLLCLSHFELTLRLRLRLNLRLSRILVEIELS